MIDPRALANFLLDLADEQGAPISNLALNKIAYFVHGSYLAMNGDALVDAKIEAWQYGPVFREIYHEFKNFKEKPISTRARILNVDTGEYQNCEYKFEQKEYDFLVRVALPYIRMSPSALVNLSHIAGGPWHQAWFHDGEVNPGMEITDDSIRSYFSRQARH